MGWIFKIFLERRRGGPYERAYLQQAGAGQCARHHPRAGRHTGYPHLGDEEYVQCLENKLREEVGEFLEERTLDELGDIIEVLEELAHLQGWTDWEIRHARSEKAQRNGIFRERIFLEKVLED